MEKTSFNLYCYDNWKPCSFRYSFFSGYYSKELIVNSGLSSNLFLSKYVYLISIIVVLLTSAYIHLD